MRALFLFCLSVIVLGPGCASEEGVLLTTSTDMPGDMEESIETLHFYIGESGVVDISESGVDNRDDYYANIGDPQEVNVAGRNLSTDPFKLLLKPDRVAASAEGVVIVVVALDGDEEVIGFGHTTELQFVSGKVLKWELTISPFGRDFELFDECRKWELGDGSMIHFVPGDDPDCDGFGEDDCKPFNPDINPGVDLDGDGFSLCATDSKKMDCDDDEFAINPGVAEICNNGFDDNCNEQIDADEDADGDGYSLCDPLPAQMDCDDGNELINPGAEEVCNGIDNNCDIAIDNLDADGDGFFPCDTGRRLKDCNDGNEFVFPRDVNFCSDDTVYFCGDEDKRLFDGEEVCFKNDATSCKVGVRDCTIGAVGDCTIDENSREVRNALCELSECSADDICASLPPSYETVAVTCNFAYSIYSDMNGDIGICATPELAQSAALAIPEGPTGCEETVIQGDASVAGWEFSLGSSETCSGTTLVVGSDDPSNLTAANMTVNTTLFVAQRNSGEELLKKLNLSIEIHQLSADSCPNTGFSCTSAGKDPWPQPDTLIPEPI